MGHISRLSDYVRGAVAVADIVEGRFISLAQSGVRLGSELPQANLTASGVTYPVYVAFSAPDNFARPTNLLQYRATWQTTINGWSNTGWEQPIKTYTQYMQGMSTLEEPTIPSGVLIQAHQGGTYTLYSGAFIASASWANESLVKVADDGTGRAQYTTVLASAVAKVEEYDASRNALTISLFRK